MLRSKSVVSLVAAGLALLAPLGAAYAEAKIGVVDVRALLSQSPQFKALQASLEQELDGRKRELLQMQSEIKAKEGKLQRDAAIMAEAERAKAQKELNDGKRDFDRKQKEYQEDGERRYNEEMERIQRILFLEVETFAKAQGFDLVVTKDVVLFRKDTIDLTSQVVAAIQLKATKAPAPAAKP
jgi:outer membrane protein